MDRSHAFSLVTEYVKDVGLVRHMLAVEAAMRAYARKFGEEAVETLIAAVAGDDAALTAEASDVLYHLLVLLQSRGISLDAVMTELERRTRQSGLAEKATRGNS